MPDYQHILLDKDASERIARLTLDRPERLNALNDLTMDELGDALEDVNGDDSVRVLIVTGAGPPISIRLSKLMLYKGLDFDLDTAMKMAAAAETITLTSRDHAEGTAAIRESRKPVYEGR